MITEINIWRAVNLLIRRHDENAELELRISPTRGNSRPRAFGRNRLLIKFGKYRSVYVHGKISVNALWRTSLDYGCCKLGRDSRHLKFGHCEGSSPKSIGADI
jgi:hypothetical protein